MCKLLIVLGAKNPSKTKEFMKEMLEPMSVCNSHGSGYTAVRKDGTIFTERWLDNKEALNGDPKLSKDNKLAKKFGGLVEVTPVPDDTYSCQGEPSWGDVTSVIMHTRFATCDKTFANVHPFVDNENITSISHNGMINNSDEFDNLNSTCDSEVILTEYNRRKIGADYKKILPLIGDLDGYWAVGATTLDEKGKRVLDIFTSNKVTSGSLVVAYLKELDGYVFSSSGDNIKTAVGKLGWEKDFSIYNVMPHVFARFDAITGKTLNTLAYADKMVTYKVSPKTHGGHTRSHSVGKDKDRRSLPPKDNGQTCAYSGTKGTNGMGTPVSGAVGHVATFYDNYGNKKSITAQPNTFTNLSNDEKLALDKWTKSKDYEEKAIILLNKQDDYDNHPSNYSVDYNNVSIKKSTDFDDKLSNFIGDHEASDSKYYKTVLDVPLSDEEVKELEFSLTLEDDEQDIINALPIDMKMSFLNTLDKEGVK